MNVNAVWWTLGGKYFISCSDPVRTTTTTPIMCLVFCRAYFALRNIVAWSETVHLLKKTEQRENTMLNIGVQRLTAVQNKPIDCDVFLHEMLLTIVNRC